MCKKNADKYPYLIVILMHDFNRNLYPCDPYIPFNTEMHRLNAIAKLLDQYVDILNKWKHIGSYDMNIIDSLYNKSDDVKIKTGKVYGALWDKYCGDMVKEAVDIIKERFSNNNIPLKLIKGKKVLDIGCGSGRYSCALAMLGAEKVIGIDYGEMGLRKGRELARINRLSNLQFKKGNIHEMPFKDEEFDFCFNNGVFQHSGSIEIPTKELYRVLKKGGYSWYYIYGDGGLFWYARKKINNFMKNAIPQEYAMKILNDIGMPGNRFIFCDNWYVLREKHTSNEKLLRIFKNTGFSEYRRASNGRSTDPDYLVVNGTLKDRKMWGDAGLRYLIRK
ncbi:class I SAM-dependent methyltransferase [Elusimicrobiota bacterium]